MVGSEEVMVVMVTAGSWQGIVMVGSWQGTVTEMLRYSTVSVEPWTITDVVTSRVDYGRTTVATSIAW